MPRRQHNHQQLYSFTPNTQQCTRWSAAAADGNACADAHARAHNASDGNAVPDSSTHRNACTDAYTAAAYTAAAYCNAVCKATADTRTNALADHVANAEPGNADAVTDTQTQEDAQAKTDAFSDAHAVALLTLRTVNL